MKLTIEITMDNDAFRDPDELSRILRGVWGKVRNQQGRSRNVVCDAPEIDDKLLDINGNTVGFVKLEGASATEYEVGDCCPECSEPLFEHDSGDLHCRGCSFIHEVM